MRRYERSILSSIKLSEHATVAKNTQVLQAKQELINLLSPKIHIQILLTVLHIFSYSISWQKLLKEQSNFPLVIILLILMKVFS